jgi:polar amino acid transport system substrate-binding protein
MMQNKQGGSKVKKYLVLLLSLVSVLAFTACGSDGGDATAQVGNGDNNASVELDIEENDVSNGDEVVEQENDAPDENDATVEENDVANESAITSMADLETALIGVQIGTTGQIFVGEELPNATAAEFPLGADAVMALVAGQVDAVIIDAEPARRFIAANPGLAILDEVLTSEYYGIALQHGSPYTEMFNDALDTLRENGTLYSLMDYWIHEDETSSRYVSPPGTEHPNGTLIMATSAGFEPFEFFEGDQIVGLDPCLANAIGDILGYEIYIEDMAFDAIILAVQAGQADFGMAGMTIRDDRLEFVDFTQGYFNSSQVAIVRY